MKLKGKATKVLLAISVLGILAIASGIWYSNIDNGKGSSGWGGISLVRPAFAQDETTSFLEKEAGMACYTKLNQKIDLASAKKAFRTIEKDTDTYIVGSIPVPGYEAVTTEDAHCFIHKDGWIVAYYLRDEPTSKIMNWQNWDGKTINPIILQCLVSASSSVGVTPNDVKYYNFKYPDANRFIIIADRGSFKLTTPTSLVIYDRSYSTYHSRTAATGRWTDYDELIIDNSKIDSAIGFLTVSQLTFDVPHVIQSYRGNNNAGASDSGIAIAIVYQGL
jgi:hypothetical protein